MSIVVQRGGGGCGVVRLSGGDDEGDDQISYQLEPVAKLDDVAGVVAFEPVADEPRLVVDCVRAEQRAGVSVFSGGLGEPVADFIGAVVLVSLVGDCRARGECGECRPCTSRRSWVSW